MRGYFEMTAPSEALPRASLFAPRHTADAVFFPAMTALVWLGIVMGFGGEMLRKADEGTLSYPLIVHVHAVVFTAWLAVFTAQVALIRTQRFAVHMTLGPAAMGLAGMMIVLGPWTALFMQAHAFGTPASDPAFLAIPMSDMISFSGLVVAGYVIRSDRVLHKRLMLLATLALADAGFGRWSGDLLGPILGSMLEPGFWRIYVPGYILSAAVVLAVPIYDVATRGKLPRGEAPAVAWVLAWHVIAVALYVNPDWSAFTSDLVRSLAGP